MVLVFENVGERSAVENYHAVSILFVVNKVFENLVNNRIVNHLEKSAFFLISSMVLGLLDRLQVFLQLYLIKLLGLLASLGLIKLWHLWRLQVFLTNVSLMEFQVKYLAIFLLFSVNDSFEWFWMGTFHKNIRLMLEFLRVLGSTLFLLFINDLLEDDHSISTRPFFC